jgi:hypothetical protein
MWKMSSIKSSDWMEEPSIRIAVATAVMKPIVPLRPHAPGHPPHDAQLLLAGRTLPQLPRGQLPLDAQWHDAAWKRAAGPFTA